MLEKYYKVGKLKLKNKLNTFLLRGNNVLCEMCGWKGSKFAKNRCPNCNSLPRTRLIPFSIKFFNLTKKNIKILHIAPNKSEYNYVNNNFNYLKYDRLDIRKYSHINIVEDLKNTTIDDNYYDLIIAWHVLEHIPDDYSAIKEMKRILKQNGRILISVPIFPTDNPKTFEDKNIKKKDYLKIHGHDDHCRSCGFDYFERFEKQGFNTKILFVKNVEDISISKFGLSMNHRAWLFKIENK